MFGTYKVDVRDVTRRAYFTERTFLVTDMQNVRESRTIHQYQFLAWPDPGVPENPDPFLAFVRRVQRSIAQDETLGTFRWSSKSHLCA